MKNQWIIIRIVLALVAIFAIGIWVGRVTTPEVSVPPIEFTLDDEEGQTDEETLKKVTRRSLSRYRVDLDLTNDQIRILRPEFVAVSRRMQVLPKASKARLAVLEDFHAELEKHLTGEQKEKLKEIMAKAKSRLRIE